MQTEFTPLVSFFGGTMIGAAALLFMACNGRIAGISGIVASVLPPQPDTSSGGSALALITGLLLAAPAWQLVTGGAPQQTMTAELPGLALAGLLVGIGSYVGNGCTSGHGVCGISRLSTRSIIATITFMLTAFITVYIIRHVWGA